MRELEPLTVQRAVPERSQAWRLQRVQRHSPRTRLRKLSTLLPTFLWDLIIASLKSVSILHNPMSRSNHMKSQLKSFEFGRKKKSRRKWQGARGARKKRSKKKPTRRLQAPTIWMSTKTRTQRFHSSINLHHTSSFGPVGRFDRFTLPRSPLVRRMQLRHVRSLFHIAFPIHFCRSSSLHFPTTPLRCIISLNPRDPRMNH